MAKMTTKTDFGQWRPTQTRGKPHGEWKKKEKENSLHEEETQIISVWIQIGMHTTANDMVGGM